VETVFECDSQTLYKRLEHSRPVSHQGTFNEGGRRNAEGGCGEIEGAEEGSGFDEKQVYFSEKPRKPDRKASGKIG